MSVETLQSPIVSLQAKLDEVDGDSPSKCENFLSFLLSLLLSFFLLFLSWLFLLLLLQRALFFESLLISRYSLPILYVLLLLVLLTRLSLGVKVIFVFLLFLLLSLHAVHS